ncbi:MAG: alpha/beta fold hydrolase [Gammaproteobacteria bacterium]|nr:alpha/beta fold hydrolase [Gammaproteobacteria bacterium]NKB65332.1 alpha/beta fold hydrolase [Gammaproteobacteria bacterium]
MQIKEQILNGLTGKVSALQVGDPRGRPILAIHGWMDNAASFIPLARQLNHYNWFCIDLPGHGKSEHRPIGSVYHLTDYVIDLLSIMDSLEWERCDLIGHSLGAGIGSIFSATFPEKVNHLVLIDGIGPVSHNDDRVPGQIRKAGESHLMRKQMSMKSPKGYESWDQLISSRQVAGKIAAQNAELLVRRAASERFDKVFVNSDKRLREPSFLYMSQGQVCQILGGIECPVLLIQALSGFVIQRETTLERIDAIPDIDVANLPGNHHLHMDTPEPVGAEIDRFLLQKKK